MVTDGLSDFPTKAKSIQGKKKEERTLPAKKKEDGKKDVKKGMLKPGPGNAPRLRQTFRDTPSRQKYVDDASARGGELHPPGVGIELRRNN